MNFAKPFGSVEIDKSTETEVEGNIRELTRGGAALRQGDSSDGEMTANNLSICCAAFQEARRARSTI